MPIEVPSFSNDSGFVLIGGMNVIESKEHLWLVGQELIKTCSENDIPFVFKVSIDKANRSSISSFRGPGFSEGLSLLKEFREHFQIPVLTDIHEPWQADLVANVADIIQIPAFLCRQTDLLRAACHTQKTLHIKKMQIMAASEMSNVIDKCHSLGNENIILCERGTSFGYNNLVVDPLNFSQLKALGKPVSFDVTHALQQPGGLGKVTGGRGEFLIDLAMVGLSQRISSLFIEFHPDPSKALCDGPCALPLSKAKELIDKAKELDDLVKGWG
jgi:2-dehydro-3-deoxyphosphooctonate aldolase (KDO 8-P synthase)